MQYLKAVPLAEGEKQQVKPAEKGKHQYCSQDPLAEVKSSKLSLIRRKPGVPEGGREKKDKKKPAKCPQKDKKKQGEEEPER